MNPSQVVQRDPLYCLVTAHPDDEAMFFVPTVRALVETGATVWLLCLTTGNYDGLGFIRQEELKRCCRDVLGISKVIVVDDEKILPDHPTKSWPLQTASQILQQSLEQAIREEWPGTMFSSVHLITFDQGGVSGHRNHRDTYFAVRQCYLEQEKKLLLQYEQHQGNTSSSAAAELARISQLRKIHSVWTLDTVYYNPMAKYLPITSWIRLLLYWSILGRVVLGVLDTSPTLSPLVQTGKDETEETDPAAAAKTRTTTFRCYHPFTVWKAMATHKSQFVWYRRLFIVFGCYTYWNRLRRLEAPATLAMEEATSNGGASKDGGSLASGAGDGAVAAKARMEGRTSAPPRTNGQGSTW